MNALLAEGSRFVSTLPGVPEGSSVHCYPCRLLKYGDLCVGRRVASTVRDKLSAEGALTVSNQRGGQRANLTIKFRQEGEELSTQSGKYASEIFTCVRFNPQGQLCLTLSRPHTFRTSIQEVLVKHSHYGHHDTACTETVALTDYCTFNDDSQMTGSPRQLSVSEGRMILIKKLLSRILNHTGHYIKESQLAEKVKIHNEMCIIL